MCLEIKKACKNRKPIQCYKVLLEVFDKESGRHVMTVTPFRYTRVPKVVLRGKKLFTAKDTKGAKLEWNCNKKHQLEMHTLNNDKTYIAYRADVGFIHVYMTREELDLDKTWYVNYLEGEERTFDGIKYKVKVVAYRCEIPAGTLYCTGKFGEVGSGCAREIKFIEKLKDYVFV